LCLLSIPVATLHSGEPHRYGISGAKVLQDCINLGQKIGHTAVGALMHRNMLCVLDFQPKKPCGTKTGPPLRTTGG
jgi:hypothetical protein